MNLEQQPTWSKGDLRRLGEALVIDKAATPDGCPQYDEVMHWYSELAAEVFGRISDELLAARPLDQLSISARPKTIDTLVQKLQRQRSLKLGQVQDIAGVRVDADIVLTQQTRLAHEIAEYFGTDRAIIRDIRENPHSGYRAVHVWLVLPAGRVEVQVRTLAQSAWANAYEGIAEFYGRGIRYGEEPVDAHVQEIVHKMHGFSRTILDFEEGVDRKWQFEHLPRRLRRRYRKVDSSYKKATPAYTTMMESMEDFLDSLRDLYRNYNDLRGSKYCGPAEEV